MIRLLRNNSFILVLALLAGILLGGGAVYTRASVTPLLAFIMTLSLVGISADAFSGGRRLVRPALLALFLNYGVLGGTLLLLTVWLIDDPGVRAGFVLIAAVPPAVAIIPFTFRLGGDMPFVLHGSVTGHLAAFLLTPLITLAALGANLVQPLHLVTTLLQLIAAPFVVSRLLRRSRRIMAWLDANRGTLINWSFFVVVYTIIGLNRGAFDVVSIGFLRVVLVAVASTTGLAYLVYGASRLAGAQPSAQIAYAVMGAWKNYGLAGAIALLYFGEAAALPAAVATAFSIINFLLLGMTISARPGAAGMH